MIGRVATTLAAIATAIAMLAPAAQAEFGLGDFEAEFSSDEKGAPAQLAGTHPFSLTTFFTVNHTGSGFEAVVDGKVRDTLFEQPAGFTGDVTGVPTCSTADFLLDRSAAPRCPLASAVGMQTASFPNPTFFEGAGPIFHLPAPPGAAARIGWKVREVPLVVDISIKQAPEYNVVAAARGINQTLGVFGSIVELWGVPGDKAHDFVRGHCASAAEQPTSSMGVSALEKAIAGERFTRPTSGAKCPADGEPAPFLTMPRSCEGPLTTRFEARSWEEPNRWVTGSHAGPGMSGCGVLSFEPRMSSRPTTDSAGTSTGLEFSIDFDHEGSGLKSTDEEARAQSELKEAKVTLPEGMTVNPSIAEGLGTCSPSDLDEETLGSDPGEGCPNSSKIGTVRVESPLVDEAVEGSVFLAPQDDPSTSRDGAENPFDSLIAFYIVLKSPSLGILVKQPAKVEPDPETGQLVTTVTDIPQIPFSSFEFRFREGQRAPLISPSRCGEYAVEAEFVPRAQPWRSESLSSEFRITRGVGGGPCPAGAPPFAPGFLAGALNNQAGAHSPFLMRLTRQDGHQDITKLAAILPPGVTGKLAGVGRCAEFQIARARAKEGREELALPSCPPASRIGSTLAGAGVGSALTYVPGSLYLAGPYNGAPLSVVSITPAVAGPFDAGTVVVRVALGLNPVSAEVIVDGSRSDPIPHILKGIPLKLRDLRVHADRPAFTLNPTSCDPGLTRATLFGSNLDLFSAADDLPVARFSRHQVAGCGALPFKPRLGLRLKGGTRRGANPALMAVLRARPGHANLERTIVRLPKSAFLDQAHIRTICTRVQWAAKACPKAAIYGRVVAHTPLLDEPLRGPVYLRSSNNKLPDLVFDLKGIVEIEAAARIDSIRGGIRAIFPAIPDAPVSKVVLRMQGGKKGLIVNSRHLCKGKARANARLIAHNAKRRALRPVVRPVACKKKRKARRSAHRRAALGEASASR